VRNALASWKYIQPNDITKTYPDDDKKEWKFCTKCKCRATNTTGIFQLSHFDAYNQDGFRPHANLSHLNDGVPEGTPLVTTKEPDEKEEDEDDILFTDSVWCCIVPNTPDSDTTCVTPKANSPNCETKLSTWCCVNDEVEVVYADSAWCCVIPNAPASDTTFTHIPVTLNKIDNEHEETSRATNVSTCEVNANSDINHVPETILDNGGLSYFLAWMLTIGSYLLNSALLGLVGPEVRIDESIIKNIKYQGEMFWRSIVIPLFFISTLFWDTLSFFTNSTDKDKNRPRVCRDVMRKCYRRIKHIRPSHAAL
jgi:hypothetical protein